MVDLPLVRREIVIGGRTWAVETVEDQDALLDAVQTSAQFPFGLMLWESAVALGEEISARPELVAGKSVLELGCGIGLGGVIADHYGGRVLATDHDRRALEAVLRTARLNGITGLSTAPGDWADWRIPGHFDVIVGADVIFDPADHAALLCVLESSLAPGGTALLADPGRTAQAAFIDRAHASGWDVQRATRAVADLKDRAGVRPLAITMLTLVRQR